MNEIHGLTHKQNNSNKLIPSEKKSTSSSSNNRMWNFDGDLRVEYNFMQINLRIIG